MQTKQLEQKINIGHGAGLYIDKNGNRLFVFCTSDKQVVVIDLKTRRDVKRMAIGRPDGITSADIKSVFGINNSEVRVRTDHTNKLIFPHLKYILVSVFKNNQCIVATRQFFAPQKERLSRFNTTPKNRQYFFVGIIV